MHLDCTHGAKRESNELRPSASKPDLLQLQRLRYVSDGLPPSLPLTDVNAPAAEAGVWWW